MKKTKNLKNLKIFGCKRKYNSPRSAQHIQPNSNIKIVMDQYDVLITNKSENVIYVRPE